MNLNDAEAAYIRRFAYEVWHRLEGPDTIREKCAGHYWDLADLATVSGIQHEVIRAAEEADNREEPPPIVPFPWATLGDLHLRAEALRDSRPVQLLEAQREDPSHHFAIGLPRSSDFNR
jgi:hypothetical protein